jgi:hypothetical protein
MSSLFPAFPEVELRFDMVDARRRVSGLGARLSCGALVLTLLFSFAEACSATNDATDSGPVEAGAPVDAPVDAFVPPTMDAGRDAAPVCFVGGAVQLVGLPPTPYRDVCSGADLAEAEAACPADPHGTACAAWQAAHPACARCLFGALGADPPESTQLGVLLPVGKTSIPNVASCAALAIGRPECALDAARASACSAASCPACASSAALAACRAYAATTVCTVAPSESCRTAIDQGEGTWDRVCRAANTGATFAKIGAFFCGAAPDAGASDSGSD